jgi:transcriptional regulator with XRE-family HTH domain
MDQQDLYSEFGDELRNRRRNAGMTQEDLAFEAGLDQSSLSKVERTGPKSVSWSKLEAVASALNCKLRVSLEPEIEEN